METVEPTTLRGASRELMTPSPVIWGSSASAAAWGSARSRLQIWSMPMLAWLAALLLAVAPLLLAPLLLAPQAGRVTAAGPTAGGGGRASMAGSAATGGPGSGGGRVGMAVSGAGGGHGASAHEALFSKAAADFARSTDSKWSLLASCAENCASVGGAFSNLGSSGDPGAAIS